MEYIGSVNFDLVELANWKARGKAPIMKNQDRISQLLTKIVQFKKRLTGKHPCAGLAF